MILNCTLIPDIKVLSLLARTADETRENSKGQEVSFHKLPRELWRACFPRSGPASCICPVCQPPIGPRARDYWDTLASVANGRRLEVWTCHYPGLEGAA